MSPAPRVRYWSGLLLLSCLVAAAGCSDSPSPDGTRGLKVVESDQAMPQGQGRRIALVIGNGNYASSPLTNPANDAELIATTLTGVGFEVQLHRDGDQKAMKRAIQQFGATLEQGGADAVGLFYYAGHGVQLGGRNYLIPVGADISRDADVEIEAVSADWVLEQMRYARNRLNFVILDACRNNPFVRSMRSASTGLAKMDAPAGVLIAYSTAPGDVAADGEGRNSPYTEALSRLIRESGEPAELMFKQTRDAVRRVTDERQTPWESSSLTGQNFYFSRTGRAAATGELAPSQPAAVPVPQPATQPGDPRQQASGGSRGFNPAPEANVPPGPAGPPDLASVLEGVWYGDVVSDARGSSRSDVMVTIRRTARNEIAITSDYRRLPAVTVPLTRAMQTIMSAEGSTIVTYDTSSDTNRLGIVFEGEVAWSGARGSGE